MDLKLPAVTFRLTGTTPLLVHNERLANPMSPAKKRLSALTGKRKKTDDDNTAIARVEFDGGLYLDEDGPYVPDSWVYAVLRDGAKKIKRGTDVAQGVTIMTDRFRLETKVKKANGETWEDAIWSAGCYDQRMVGNQKVRVLRTRPRFDVWSTTITINYDPSVFNDRDFAQILEIAGIKVGLGDYRPRFGRFSVETL